MAVGLQLTDDAQEEGHANLDLSQKSVRELKSMLKAAGIDSSSCVEKSELRELCESHLALSDTMEDDWDEDNCQDFMHGFTAVFGINKGIQSS